MIAHAVLLIAALEASAATAPPPRTPDRVKVVFLPFPGYAPLILADANGYFAQQGIEIESITMPATTTAIPALAQGQIDVLPMTIRGTTFAAIGKGARIRMVADMGHFSDNCSKGSLVVRNDPRGAPIRRGRLAFSRLGTSEYFAKSLLGARGLDPSAFEVVELPNRLQFEAVLRGTVDGGIVSDEELAKIRETGGFSVLGKFEDVQKAFQYSVLTFGPNLLDRNPDLGRRFMAAYLRGVKTYNEGKTPRNISLLTGQGKLDLSDVVSSCWLAMREDGQIQPDSLEVFQNWAVRQGWFDRVVPFTEYWDGRFLPTPRR